jgi:hypothetical protein
MIHYIVICTVTVLFESRLFGYATHGPTYSPSCSFTKAFRFLCLLQSPEKLGQLSNGVDNLATSLGDHDGFRHRTMQEVQKASHTGGACTMCSGQTMDLNINRYKVNQANKPRVGVSASCAHQDTLAFGNSSFDEVEQW